MRPHFFTARASALAPLGLCLLAGCREGAFNDGFFGMVETGFGGEGCWDEGNPEGLARLVDGAITVTLTPAEPGRWHFTAAALVSGGTVDEHALTESEAFFVLTPEALDTPVLFSAELGCVSDFDQGQSAWTLSVDPSALSDAWSVIGAVSPG